MTTIRDIVQRTHRENPENKVKWAKTVDCGFRHLKDFLDLPADELETVKKLFPHVEKDWDHSHWDDPKYSFRDVVWDILAKTKKTEIIEWVISRRSEHYIQCLTHPLVSMDLVLSEIERDVKKSDDPMGYTNGGEFRLFLLHTIDPYGDAPRHPHPDVIDACARNARQTSTQKSALYCINISFDTLEYLLENGKTPKVKEEALQKLYALGHVKISRDVAG